MSPAKETAERRLGRGRNDLARLRFCDCGGCASALRAHVPLSTAPPSRTSGLPMRFARSLQLPPAMEAGDGAEGGETGLLVPAAASCLRSLWRLHRNEPGWFVGEHMQGRQPLAVADDADETLTDLPGVRAPQSAASLMRVGEEER